MTTPLDLITGALELIGVIEPGENDLGAATSALFKRMNRMLGAWSADSTLIFADTKITHDLTPGVALYTIGPGAMIDTVRPTRIKTAYVRESGTDYSVEVVDEYKYAGFVDKAITGTPGYLYYNPDSPIGEIRLLPVPDAAQTLIMGVEIPLTAFSGVAQELELPPGYEEAIEYNFAKRIAGSYGRTLSPEQTAVAATGLADIKRQNRKNDRFEASYDVPAGQCGYFDGNSGRII